MGRRFFKLVLRGAKLNFCCFQFVAQIPDPIKKLLESSREDHFNRASWTNFRSAISNWFDVALVWASRLDLAASSASRFSLFCLSSAIVFWSSLSQNTRYWGLQYKNDILHLPVYDLISSGFIVSFSFLKRKSWFQITDLLTKGLRCDFSLTASCS